MDVQSSNASRIQQGQLNKFNGSSLVYYPKEQQQSGAGFGRFVKNVVKPVNKFLKDTKLVSTTLGAAADIASVVPGVNAVLAPSLKGASKVTSSVGYGDPKMMGKKGKRKM